jgi:DNA-binding NtrC family response regulator
MTVPTKPAPSQVSPTLALLALGDSFSTLWPRLAEECGLVLQPLGDENGSIGSASRIVVLSVAGAEPQMEDALRRLAAAGLAPVVVGGMPDHHLAQRALRGGGQEYFALPGDAPLLRSWLTRQGEQLRAQAASERFASREAAKFQFEGILGQSPALREALERAARVIPHAGVTILITGETGTGKELLARAIHYNGPRRSAPFVDVNCAAIPEQLLESELFGHEKGSFTDATAAKPGLFEVASGGTIFLDEIGHLSLALQGKLLRALEQRQIRRVGATTPIEVDVRIVAATHVDLADASRRGEFREDLYYRLNVVGLRLPALRERAGDLPLLARALLARFARDYGLAEPGLTPGAERRLLSHPWPGNIRELRNVLERAILLGTPGAPLSEADLGLDSTTTIPGPNGTVPFPASMSDITRAAASGMVQLCEGNKSEAARRLRISRTRLLRLLAPRGRRPLPSEEDR